MADLGVTLKENFVSVLYEELLNLQSLETAFNELKEQGRDRILQAISELNGFWNKLKNPMDKQFRNLKARRSDNAGALQW